MKPMHRSRALLALAAAAAALAALAGCGGIPTAGPVVEGPQLSEADPDYTVDPNGPLTGATPQEVLEGFMLAVGSPENGYRVAREFLTAQAAEAWKPDDGVLVRDGAASVAAAAGSTDAAPALEYAFSSAAAVDGDGRYREAAGASRHALDFAFQQVAGEWRISAAPNGIVLTEVAFARAFAAVPLYFFDQSERYLVPDVRWIASRSSTPTTIVNALFKGPDSWLSPALVTEFPTGTSLGSGGAVVNGARASVDLGAVASAVPPNTLARMQQQLAATLGVADVSLTAAGLPLSPGSTGSAPIIDPQPAGSLLVGTGDAFGFADGTGVTPVDGISAVLVADGATAAALSRDQRTAVYLAGDGTVRLLAAGAGASTRIDDRPGLLAPALDPFGYVWSATGGAGGRIEAFGRDGAAVAGLDVEDLPPDAGIAGIAVSRDGTRLAVLLSSGSATRLLVFGIARQGGAPAQLRSPLELLAVQPGSPVSVAWVDDRSLVVVTAQQEGAVHAVRLIPIGSPSSDLDALADDGTAVGGRGGASGIRALADGEVLAATGSGSGWSGTGVAARFLAVQQ